MPDQSAPLGRVGLAVAPVSVSLWWAGLALMVAGLLAPIVAVDVPPLTDYANHLARSYFLAFGAQNPVMQRIFAVHWDLIPNLAMDLILPPLMHIIPPLLAGKLIVALAVLLPTTGAIALSRASFGRLSLWQLGAGFVAYDTMFLVGSLNFQLAVGVALWGAAAWIATAQRHPLIAVLAGAAFALVAFVFHLFGFGFFALLIGCHELAGIARRGLASSQVRRYAAGRGAMVVATLATPVILYVASPLAATGGSVVWQTPIHKLFFLLVPWLAYSRLASLIVVAGLAVAVITWSARGQLRVAPLAWAGVPLLLLIYAVLPLGAKGGFWIDTRIPVLLGFMLFAAVTPRRLGRREAVAATVVLALLFAGRMAYITSVWMGSRQDVADVRRVLTPVTPGSRVLVVDADPDQHELDKPAMPPSRIVGRTFGTAYWHYGAFALIDRDAFWSNAFTMVGQQPMVARPPYDASGNSGAAPPPGVLELGPNVERGAAPAPTSFIAGWPGKFDYVLVLAADTMPRIDTLLPDRLELLDDQGIAALFKVRR